MSKIIGNTTTTPVPRSDWSQTDKKKADYIRNKPELGAISEKNIIDKSDLNTDIQLLLEEIEGKINTEKEIKGSSSGEVVVLTDISPLEHEIKVNLTSVESDDDESVVAGGKNLFHFTEDYNKSGEYYEDDENNYGELQEGSHWSFEALKGTSKFIINNDSGDCMANYPLDSEDPYIQNITFDLKPLMASLDQNKQYTISAHILGEDDYSSSNSLIYFAEEQIFDIDYMEGSPFSFIPSQLSDDAKILYFESIYMLTCTIGIQIEEGDTATEYEDFVSSEKNKLNMEEILNSSEFDQFASDITESGIYIIESVFTSGDSDVTSITFKDGKKVSTVYIEGEPFKVGDSIYVEVNGDNQIFYIVHGIYHGVTVQKYGKNLFDHKDFLAYTKSNGGGGVESVEYLGEECFSYKAWAADATKHYEPNYFKENTQYTFTIDFSYSYNNTASYAIPIMVVYYTDGTYTELPSYDKQTLSTEFRHYTFTTPVGKTVKSMRCPRFGAVGTIYVKNFQIELGTESTESEEYKEPITLTADENGIVKGVTSLYPTTTLLTDTKGITINVEYIKNVNKVLDIESYNDVDTSLVVGANISDVLRFSNQNLTEEQKTQVVNNLGLYNLKEKTQVQIITWEEND